MKIKRNKNCKECPQNKREDVVWNKGYQDGFEVGQRFPIHEHNYQYQLMFNEEKAKRLLFCTGCGHIKYLHL